MMWLQLFEDSRAPLLSESAHIGCLANLLFSSIHVYNHLQCYSNRAELTVTFADNVVLIDTLQETTLSHHAGVDEGL